MCDRIIGELRNIGIIQVRKICLNHVDTFTRVVGTEKCFLIAECNTSFEYLLQMIDLGIKYICVIYPFCKSHEESIAVQNIIETKNVILFCAFPWLTWNIVQSLQENEQAMYVFITNIKQDTTLYIRIDDFEVLSQHTISLLLHVTKSTSINDVKFHYLCNKVLLTGKTDLGCIFMILVGYGDTPSRKIQIKTNKRTLKESICDENSDSNISSYVQQFLSATSSISMDLHNNVLQAVDDICVNQFVSKSMMH